MCESERKQDKSFRNSLSIIKLKFEWRGFQKKHCKNWECPKVMGTKELNFRVENKKRFQGFSFIQNNSLCTSQSNTKCDNWSILIRSKKTLWNKMKPKIKNSTWIKNFQDGGLENVDVKSKIALFIFNMH